MAKLYSRKLAVTVLVLVVLVLDGLGTISIDEQTKTSLVQVVAAYVVAQGIADAASEYGEAKHE